jgi:hypothetical protein
MVTLLACSTKKNRFLNRKYHALTTEYNILYNGEIALERGWKEIQDIYKDNYWNVLAIEPLDIQESPAEKFASNTRKISENKRRR